MLIPNELQIVLNQSGGIVTAAQANAAGISNERLRLFVKSGALQRANFGVYILPGILADEMFIAQLRRPKIIYSHETALFLHGLSKLKPGRFTVTIPTGYSAARLQSDGFSVFSIKRELHELGAVNLKTSFGNSIRVYDLERTICDCLRSRNRLDSFAAADALKQYIARKDKDLIKLAQTAEILRVTKPLKSYLEVLL